MSKTNSLTDYNFQTLGLARKRPKPNFNFFFRQAFDEGCHEELVASW